MVKIYMLFFILDDHTECKWGDVARDVARSDLVWGQVILGSKKLMGEDLLMKNWKPYTVYLNMVLEDVCRSLTQVQRKRLAKLWIDYAEASRAETVKLAQKHKFKTVPEIIEVRPW